MIRKKQNNRNSGRKPTTNPNLIAQQKLLGIPAKRLLIFQDTLSSLNGSTDLVSAVSGSRSLNVQSFAGSLDMPAITSAYRLMRIKYITIKVSRIVNETVFNSVYPSGIGPLHIAYLPDLTNTSISNNNVVRMESSARFPIMSTTTVQHTWKVPDMNVYNYDSLVVTTDYNFNLTKWFPTLLFNKVGGLFCFGANLPGSAASTTALFSIEYHIDLEAALPN